LKKPPGDERSFRRGRTVRALQSMAYEISNHQSNSSSPWLKEDGAHLLQYKDVGKKKPTSSVSMEANSLHPGGGHTAAPLQPRQVSAAAHGRAADMKGTAVLLGITQIKY